MLEGVPSCMSRSPETPLYLFTDRVLSTREGNVLTRVCVSVHTCGGGEGTPSQVWGAPWPGLDGGGVPQPGLVTPHPPTTASTCYAQAVCLLRLRWRNFLLNVNFSTKCCCMFTFSVM